MMTSPSNGQGSKPMAGLAWVKWRDYTLIARGVIIPSTYTSGKTWTHIGNGMVTKTIPPSFRKSSVGNATMNLKSMGVFMNQQEIEALWQENVNVINRMGTEQGSTIRTTLLCAERNGPTYVRLFESSVNEVRFELVEGPEQALKDCAEHYGVEIAGSALKVSP